ncbi:Secretory carrier-associated membrane protein 5 [Phlyctochytrium bullatum]|nr:Secretory carrier-associated membrane protein 5 [Phlyctochytrium bullatum]
MRFIPVSVDVIIVATLFASVRRAGNFEFRLDRIKNILIRWALLQLLFIGDTVLDAAVSVAGNYPTYFERRLKGSDKSAIAPSSVTTSTTNLSLTAASTEVSTSTSSLNDGASMAATVISAMVGGASGIFQKVLESAVQQQQQQQGGVSQPASGVPKIVAVDGEEEIVPVAPSYPPAEGQHHMKLRERGRGSQRSSSVQPTQASNQSAFRRSKGQDQDQNPFEVGDDESVKASGVESETSHTRGNSSNPWGGSTDNVNGNLTSIRSLNTSRNNLASEPSRPVPPRPATSAGRSAENSVSPAAPPSLQLKPTGNTASLSAREAEIERREAELRHREARLAEKESNLSDYNPPNWPPCRPLVYHDIQNDIPEGGRWLVKRLYMGFYLSSVAYLMNFVAAFALLVVKAESAGGTFGLALVIFLVGIPVSSGVKHDRSISFFLFFFNYGFHLAVSALLSVGIPGWGGAGVIYTLAQIGSNPGAGILCAIASGLLIFEVVYGVWQMKAVSGYYRSKGLTAEQAKQQAISGVASSNIGREFAGAALRSQMAPDASRR